MKPLRIVFLVAFILPLAPHCVVAGKANRQKVETIRKELLDRVVVQEKKLSIPSQIANEYAAIIISDSTPIDPAIVAGLFEKPPVDRDMRIRRISYVTAILFRERENPVTIEKWYNQFTPEEKITTLALLSTVFKPFVDQDYFDLARDGFNGAILDAVQNRAQKKEGQDPIDDIALSWIDLLALTNNPGTGKLILQTTQDQVHDSSFRFNIVGRAMGRLGADAVPVAQWYFELFAWRPFEIETIATYLDKYGEPAANKGLFAAKLDAFRQGEKSLKQLGAVDIDQLARPSTRPAQP